jgi:hypothetical protein
MKQHKHAELIKAWADGAIIQNQSELYGVITLKSPAWNHSYKYRIKPDCEYAIEKIRELGGDEAVSLYKYLLNGGKIECKAQNGAWFELVDVNDPFHEFSSVLEMQATLRKKKHTVKHLWVNFAPINSNQGYKFPETYCTWCDDDKAPEQIGTQDWHKVPTCTREVEIE